MNAPVSDRGLGIHARVRAIWVFVVAGVLLSASSGAARASVSRPTGKVDVYFARTGAVSVKLVVLGDVLIGVATRGEVACDDGTRHRQFFTEGVPTEHGLPRVARNGRFHYHQFDPFRQGLPESFEAMEGRLVQGGIRGRVRVWERAAPVDGGRRCGTGGPTGKWEDFLAKRR